MRLLSVTICPIVVGSLLLCGCIGPVRVRSTQPTTIVELEKQDRHTQTLAVILGSTPETAMGRRIGQRFLSILLETMQKENRNLKLLSGQNATFPDFLKPFGQADKEVDTFAIADVARRKGCQGFLVVRLMDLWLSTEETGVLWWRKPRHYLSIAVTVDLYDPFTAAKMTSILKEQTFSLSSTDLQLFIDGDDRHIKKMDKEIADMAEECGEQAAEHMADQPWETTVLRVEPEAVILAAGGQSGFKPNDRLDVYAAQRTMKDLSGQKFIVPGYKVGQVRVASMEGRFMRAAIIEGSADISVGDLVVAAKSK